jgi:hypothetical protein
MMRTSPILLGLLVAACSPGGKPQADPDKGVCFRVRDGAREVLDRPIPNLQTCAQRLEAVRMMEGGAVEGFFEGSFIFATEAELSSARARDGRRYPVLEPAQRTELQRAIQKLIEAEKGRDGGARPAR